MFMVNEGNTPILNRCGFPLIIVRYPYNRQNRPRVKNYGITGCRAVGRSENPGVPVLFGRHNLPPFVEIGLTDLPKFEGAMAPPAPPGTIGLLCGREAYYWIE